MRYIIYICLLGFLNLISCACDVIDQRSLLKYAEPQIKVCDDVTCKSPQNHVSKGYIVRGCLDGNVTNTYFFFYYYYYDYTKSSWEIWGCIDVKTVKSNPCPVYTTESVVIDLPNRASTYVIKCGTNFEEIPYVSNPRTILNLELKPGTYYMYPTDLIVFSSICSEVEPLEYFSPSTAISKCVYRNKVKQCPIPYKDMSVKVAIDPQYFKINVIIKIPTTTPSVVGRYDMKYPPFDMNKGPYFDLLETIFCTFIGSTHKPSYFYTKPISIRIKGITDANIMNVKNIVLTPDLKMKPNTPYTAECYFGDKADETLPDFFVSLSTHIIYINQDKLSEFILKDNAGNIIDAVTSGASFEIFFGAFLYCKNKIIVLRMTSNGVAPLSKQIQNAKYDNNPDLLISDVDGGEIKAEWLDKTFIAQCDFDAAYILVVSQPLSFGFTNIWPKYSPKYYLRGFVFACYGINVTNVEIECLNCNAGQELTTAALNLSFIQIQIQHDYQTEVELQYKCQVTLANSYKFKKYISIYIVPTFSLSYDETNLLIYPRGPVNCRADLTIIKGSTRQQTSISWPIWIKMALYVYKSLKEFNTLPEPPFENVSTSYEYCCPTLSEGKVIGSFDISSFIKCDTFVKLKAVWNYRLEYNVPLDKIYPDTVLKCYFCVNFTIYPYQDRICNKTNRIESYLDYNETRMYDKTPVTKMLHDVSEVVFPSDFSIDDNSSNYLDVKSLNIDVNCKIRLNERTPTEKIIMKDCLSDPPEIYVTPRFKSLLYVTESVGCSTDFFECQGRMNYSIEIKSKTIEENYPQLKSIVLMRKHMSINTVVKCFTGTVNPRSATQSFRIEGPPANLEVYINTINRFPGTRIMQKGDYLLCSYDGFPVPDIEWRQISGPSELVVSEYLILISQKDETGIYRLEVEVSNAHGSVKTTVEIEVFNNIFHWYDHETAPPIIILVILTLIFLFIESMIVPFIFYEKFGCQIILEHLKKKQPDIKEGEVADRNLQMRKRSMSVKKLDSTRRSMSMTQKVSEPISQPISNPLR